VVDVVAHQVVGDALRHRLTFELPAIVDWNNRRKKHVFLTWIYRTFGNAHKKYIF